jgi:hypothetical protein
MLPDFHLNVKTCCILKKILVFDNQPAAKPCHLKYNDIE